MSFIGRLQWRGERAEVTRLFGKRREEALRVVEGAQLGRAGDIVSAAVDTAGAARVLEVLATAGTARADVYAIAEAHGADPEFPKAVEAEAERWTGEPGFDTPDLEDLTGLAFVTIDNADSRDLDQALHIEEDGATLIVRYALADASYYVRPMNPLFDEALKRGTSVYFPGMCAPMLPRVLSEGLVSLNPQKIRRALVFEMVVDRDGECLSTRLFRARMMSVAKLTYDGVQTYFDQPEDHPYEEESFRNSLWGLRELGLRRMARAKRAGKVEILRVGTRIGLTPDGAAFELTQDTRNDVERYNEQLSLLCNIQGALKIHPDGNMSESVQPVFRVHAGPDDEALSAIETMIKALVDHHQLPPKRWQWRPAEGQSLADYIDQLPRDPESRRWVMAVSRQILVQGRASRFVAEPGAHYGVGASAYARFSSPMREIVGIFTHREALQQHSVKAPEENARDVALREAVIKAGNHAKSHQRRVEKSVHRAALDRLLGPELKRPVEQRPIRKGTLMGMRGPKLYILFDEPWIEVKLYADNLDPPMKVSEDGIYVSDATGTIIWAIGDALSLMVTAGESKRGRWNFKVLPES